MLLNGQPASEISLLDRGLAYGDGLFETILVHQGNPVFLARHLHRLQHGCIRLGMQLDINALQQELLQVLALPASRNSVVKVIVTRLAGGRGYRPGSSGCNRIITLHAAPDHQSRQPGQGIAMFVCKQRLARQPVLAGLKHLNRLEQVLASQEWPAETFMEGLMLDTEGLVIEGTRSNVFAVIYGKLLTPDLRHCGVAGVMRGVLLEKFAGDVGIASFTLDQLKRADELFVCNGINGVWPVTELHVEGQPWQYPLGARSQQAQAWFVEALA